MPSAYVVGTFDTKGAELRYVRDLLEAAGIDTVTVDLSTGRPASPTADVPAHEVAGHHPDGPRAVPSDDRGAAVSAMARAFSEFLPSRVDLAGVIGLGGSGGTSMITAGMRALPVGVPKVMVSTMASGDVASYVGPTDVTMMHSVTDVAGLNAISRVVLGNAAHALAGMIARPLTVSTDRKPALGLTMFGVTTPCVIHVVDDLKADFDCLVFHATGTGGQAMEKLVDDGSIGAVLDITTTEVCDLLCGGTLAATDDRFGAIIRTGVPYVGSCGGLDMVNFGPEHTVPERYRRRTLYPHNPSVTLMRTTAAECDRIGEWIGTRLNRMTGEVRFLIPEGGVSMVDAPGQPFWDPDADRALFAALERSVDQTDSRRLVRTPQHINDAQFATSLVAAFADACRLR